MYMNLYFEKLFRRSNTPGSRILSGHFDESSSSGLYEILKADVF